MLSKIKILKGYSLDALDDVDGKIGKVKEFYFDDRHWTIRYLVANTGNWFTGRQVLISPYSLEAIFKEERTIDVALTKKQLKTAPRWTPTSLSPANLRIRIMGIMTFPRIGLAHTAGDIIPTSSATVDNGKHPLERKKRGITICAARMR
ncbi:MAG: PRC-barrel domain-containing protein [Verrucomicrobiia bacterium]